METRFMNKIRKQIYLDQWQETRLAELATNTGVSEAEIIRHALDSYLLALEELPSDHPLSLLAGIGSSKKGAFGGSNHDEVIYKSYR
jgi:hypothetical protein